MKLKNIRIGLLIAISVLLLILMERWYMTYPPVSKQSTQSTAVEKSAEAKSKGNNIPNLHSHTAVVTNKVNTENSVRDIAIQTDLFDLHVDPKNGNIVSAKLKKYTKSLENHENFSLLTKQDYTLQSSILSDKIPHDIHYQTEKTHYNMLGDTLVVNLAWQNEQGLSINKRFTFKKNSYVIGISYDVKNHGDHTLYTRIIDQLLRTKPQKTSGSFMTSYANYTGGAYSTPEKHYQKVSFSDMHEQNLEVNVSTGWVAMIEHYFLSAIVPKTQHDSTFYSRVYDQNYYAMGVASSPIEITSNDTKQYNINVYLGPAITDQLKQVAPYLDLTIDYGWLWFISETIFWVIEQIHTIVGNWGWSIVLVTLLIKLLFYPLSAKSYRSMAKMRTLQPQMEQIKARYGDDRQKLGQETMALYRREGANPFGGCLPMIVQIPVFIALYWVIMENIQFRQAPFMLWIHDLAVMDPYYILPVLMGISMFIQQRLNPPPPDPTQAKVMMALPFVFTLMFSHMPSGLVLYWFVNNCLGILQQWFVNYSINKKAKA